MQNLLNFDKMLPYLMILTPMKPPFFCTFWFYLILESVFEVFIADLYEVLHNYDTHNTCCSKCCTFSRMTLFCVKCSTGMCENN